MSKYILPALTCLLVLTACNKTGNTTSSDSSITASTVTTEVKELGNEEFRELVGEPQADGKHWKFASDKPIIIDFYATWCGPCKKMAPNVARLAQEYDGKINIYKVNVENARETASIFGFNSIPTLLFLNPASGQLWLKSGYQDYSSLKDYIKETLGL